MEEKRPERGNHGSNGKFDQWTEVVELLQSNEMHRAIDKAMEASEKSIDDTGNSVLLLLAKHVFAEKGPAPDPFRELLKRAADSGIGQMAYNYAYVLVRDARCDEDYKEAARYYQIAFRATNMPAVKAMAISAFADLVQAGRVTGEPDWATAVELYEDAAEMGLLNAMFNAGTVSSWLAYEKSQPSYAYKANDWLLRAVRHVESGKPILDAFGKQEINTIVSRCKIQVAALNINEMIDGADLDHGYSVLRHFRDQGVAEAEQHLERAAILKLRNLGRPERNTPAENWRLVLGAIGWKISSETSVSVYKDHHGYPMNVEQMTATFGCGISSIPVLVMEDGAIPFGDGKKLFEVVAGQASERHPDGFILLPRQAAFVEEKDITYTPAFVRLPDTGLSMVSMGVKTCSPADLISQARNGTPFMSDPRHGSESNMLPIAQNLMDEGLNVHPVQGHDLLIACFEDVWRVPYVDPFNVLYDFGVLPSYRRVLLRYGITSNREEA